MWSLSFLAFQHLSSCAAAPTAIAQLRHLAAHRRIGIHRVQKDQNVAKLRIGKVKDVSGAAHRVSNLPRVGNNGFVAHPPGHVQQGRSHHAAFQIRAVTFGAVFLEKRFAIRHWLSVNRGELAAGFTVSDLGWLPAQLNKRLAVRIANGNGVILDVFIILTFCIRFSPLTHSRLIHHRSDFSFGLLRHRAESPTYSKFIWSAPFYCRSL
jgi:hypothetical protein